MSPPENMSKLSKILLIDDDEPTNFLNGLVIERSKLAEEVVSVNSGREALDYLISNDSPPDLILLDINMPLMDGWDFIEEFVKLNYNPEITKIIMLTSSISYEDRSKADNNPNVTDFKSKPLNKDILQEIIDKYF